MIRKHTTTIFYHYKWTSVFPLGVGQTNAILGGARSGWDLFTRFYQRKSPTEKLPTALASKFIDYYSF